MNVKVAQNLESKKKTKQEILFWLKNAFPSMNVAIVWWKWDYWQAIWKLAKLVWFRVFNILEKKENETEEIYLENNKEIFTKCDLIIFSIPIKNTIDSVRKAVDIIVWDKLIIDVTWIKNEISLEFAKMEVSETISIHPMWGPFVKSLEWQNMVEIGNNKWNKWKALKRFFEFLWVNIVQLEENEHDKKMAIIQWLTQLLNMIFISTLEKLWIKPNEICDDKETISELQSLISARFLNQKASLYASMQLCNKIFINDILSLLESIIIDITWIYKNNNEQEFRSLLEDIKLFLKEDVDHWQDFIAKSRKKTKTIKKLVNIKEFTDKTNNEVNEIKKLSDLLSIIFISVLKKLNIHPTELEPIETPIYQLQALIAWEFLSNDFDCIVEQHVWDSYFSEKIVWTLNIAANELILIDKNNDSNEFEKIFNYLASFLWEEFRKFALNITLEMWEKLKQSN
jgi:prephenate dehydrogenase